MRPNLNVPMMLSIVGLVLSTVPSLRLPLQKYSPASVNSSDPWKSSLKGMQTLTMVDLMTVSLCTHSSWVNVSALLERDRVGYAILTPMYTCTRMRKHAHTDTHTHTRARTHTHTHTHIHTHTHTHTHTHAH